MKPLATIILLFSLFALNACAQWQQTNGLFGGNINCLAAHGDSLWAGTDNCIWLSTDSGNTWQNSSNGIPFKTVITSIAIDGNNMYASSCCNGVFRSSNMGNNWQALTTQFAINGAQDILVDNHTVYVTASQSLYATADTGTTYTNLTNGTITNFISCFAKSGPNIYLGTHNAGIYTSHDNGLTWQSDTLGSSGVDVLSITTVDNAVFASVLSGGVYVSPDSGAHWMAINNGLNSYYTSELLALDSNLFVAVNDTSIYGSSNNGSQWNAVSHMPLRSTINCFATMGSVIFAGTNKGVFRSENNGLNWTMVNNALASPGVNCLATGSGNYLYAASAIGTIYSTIDNGNTWTLNNENPPESDITSLATLGSTLLAATSNGLWSNDYLINSSGFIFSLPSGPVGPVAVSSTTIFCVTSNGVERSSNNAATWINIHSGIPNGQTVTALATTNNNVYSVFAGTGSYGSLHYASVNGFGFAGWGNSNLSPVNALSINGSKAFVGTNYGIYSSTNNGVNYSFYNTQAKVNAILYHNGYVIAGTDSGVYFSVNNGLLWTKKNNGLMSHTKVTSVAAIDTLFFVGTSNGGVFRSSISTILNDTLLLTRFNYSEIALDHDVNIYPNPTSDKLYMVVKNAAPKQYGISVFDVLGSAIQVQVTQTPSYSNAEYFTLSTNNLKNGVYFVKVGDVVRRFIKE